MTLTVTVCNPLLRTPLSLLVDDSCPVVNLTYYWIRQRQAWLAKHTPNAPFRAGNGDPAKLHLVPQTIPAAFARKWGEWCAESGVQGKFSIVPYPAGVARVDQGFPGFPHREFTEWMRTVHEIIHPNFDITCEMMTHSHVVDLKTWQLRDIWEQYEWVDPPVEELAEYIAASMQVLKDAGLPCEGVTSPGAFGTKQEESYARAILQAAQEVYGNKRPFYLLHVNVPPDEWPDVPIWHADRANGTAVASIIGCTDDWFGSWTGYDAGSPDRFITADLQGGVLPQVLARELPCVLVSHWPGMYFNGEEVGFHVLQEVKRRLDAYDPDGTQTRWMKFSAIGHYWMARQLSEIGVTHSSPSAATLQIATRFPTDDFTLAIDHPATQVSVNGAALRQVQSRQQLAQGTFWNDGQRSVMAFPLVEGTTVMQVELL
ncbi:MAG: hypothetical protein KDE53_05635 [Caldilineaceae bacterium]|nr:hypothetical protein [Caldilineaceae bacterium]